MVTPGVMMWLKNRPVKIIQVILVNNRPDKAIVQINKMRPTLCVAWSDLTKGSM